MLLSLKFVINQLLQVLRLWWANILEPVLLFDCEESGTFIKSFAHHFGFRDFPILLIVGIGSVIHLTPLLRDLERQRVDLLPESLLRLMLIIILFIGVILLPETVVGV